MITTCIECEGYGYLECYRVLGNSEGKDYYVVKIECEECYGRGVIDLQEV